MAACDKCGNAQLAPSATTCSQCGAEIRSEAGAGRPAHLALLDGASSGAPKKQAKERFVSSAGPSLPVRKPADDSVPSGSSWMQRLEAARQAGLLSAIPEVDADEFNSIPPTNANTNADLGNAGFAAKPAHLLVAELEEAEARKREKARATTSEDVGLGDDPSGSLSIAALEITKPKADVERHERKLPSWVLGLVITLVALIVGAVAYNVGFSEPPPESARDHTELVHKLETRKKAIAAMEQGHKLAMIGGAKADAAIVAYEKALGFEPTLAKAHKGLGSVYATKKDVPKMVEHYKKYLALDPTADDAAAVQKIIDKHDDDPMRPKKPSSGK